MAILLNSIDDSFQCVLIGCHCKNKKIKCGCEKIIYQEKFDIHRASPITRLILHSVMGRQHKLDQILEKFTKHFEEDKVYQESHH